MSYEDFYKSPGQYAEFIRAHAQLSSKDSLYPGRHFTRLAEFLGQQHHDHLYTNPLGKSINGNSAESFASLYDLRSDEPNQPIHLQDPREFEARVKKGADNACSMLLFLKGYPTPQWISSVGSTCNVDPEFWQRHLDFWSTTGMPDYFPLPSLPSSSANIVKLLLTTIGSRGAHGKKNNQLVIDKLRTNSAAQLRKYLHELRTGTSFKPGDSLIRKLEIHNEMHFSLEQEISICVNRLRKGWISIVWLDIGPTVNSGPSTQLFSTIRPSTPLILYPTIRHKPQETWKDRPTSINSGLGGAIRDSVQSASLLHRNYGKLLNPELAASDAFYALHELFDFTIYSENQFLNMMESIIMKEMDGLGTTAFVPTLSNLIHSKRALGRHRQRIQQSISSIKSRGFSSEGPNGGDPEWPHAEDHESRKHAQLAAQKLLGDFQYLSTRAQGLVEQCDSGMNIFMNNAMIAESKRAIAQAEGVAKLTRLAFFYIPLSFTTSLFGMNFYQLGSGSLSIWLWFAVSCPVLLVSAFLLVFDIVGFLRKLKVMFRRDETDVD